MRPLSAKRQRLQRKRRALVAAMLAEDPYCDLGPAIELVDATHRCAGEAIGLHERRKRSSYGSLLDRRNLRRCCAPCNSWVEDHPNPAHLLGLVVRPGDREWDELARTRDETT